jgi:predicted dehydrogenase
MRHLPVGHAEPLRAELLAFVRAVQSGKEPEVSGEQGVASLAVAIRCLDPEAKPAATLITMPKRRAAARQAGH